MKDMTYSTFSNLLFAFHPMLITPSQSLKFKLFHFFFSNSITYLSNVILFEIYYCFLKTHIVLSIFSLRLIDVYLRTGGLYGSLITVVPFSSTSSVVHNVKTLETALTNHHIEKWQLIIASKKLQIIISID
jgi:hypothetical protein